MSAWVVPFGVNDLSDDSETGNTSSTNHYAIAKKLLLTPGFRGQLFPTCASVRGSPMAAHAGTIAEVNAGNNWYAT